MQQTRYGGFFALPQLGTYLILAVNLIVFALTIPIWTDPADAGRGFQAIGAIGSDTLAGGEYWRLIAYAFLHLGLAHILSNMLCLVSWGGDLEERIGTTYYLVIYLASAIGAGLVSIAMHHRPFLTVGASGAISGIVGALLYLWLTGKLAVSGRFFLINIGLNVLLLAAPLQVDSMAHLGGFLTGLASAAVLDGLERLFARALACKFPEYVKLNVVLVGVGLVAVLAATVGRDILRLRTSWDELLLVAAIFAIVLKLVDFMLQQRQGLAAVVLAFATFYGLVPLLIAGRIGSLACATGPGRLCDTAHLLPWALALAAFGLTLALLRRQLLEGWRDDGRLAARFRARRGDRPGI